MYKPRRILFLSAPFGHGHAKAAQAVVAAIKELDQSVDVRNLDIFDEYPHWFGSVIARTYLRFVATTPRVYGKLYRVQNRIGKYFSGRKLMHSIGAARMLRMVNRIRPSVVVCTHFLPAGILDSLIASKQINVPVYAIITDYTLHYWWVFRHLRKYFVGSEDMQQMFSKHGIDEKKVLVTGIPTNLRALSGQSVVLKRKMQLDVELPVIAIMGGGTGMLPLDEIVLELDKLTEKFQIVVVAGTNMSMYRKLITIKSRIKKHLRVYSYIDFVNEVLAVSDMLISKPGGLTVTETLCAGVPMIVFKPIPGHETDNTDFLLRHKAAVVADNLAQVAECVRKHLCSPQALAQLSDRTRRLGKNDAAHLIAVELLKNI